MEEELIIDEIEELPEIPDTNEIPDIPEIYETLEMYEMQFDYNLILDRLDLIILLMIFYITVNLVQILRRPRK